VVSRQRGHRTRQGRPPRTRTKKGKISMSTKPKDKAKPEPKIKMRRWSRRRGTPLSLPRSGCESVRPAGDKACPPSSPKHSHCPTSTPARRALALSRPSGPALTGIEPPAAHAVRRFTGTPKQSPFRGAPGTKDQSPDTRAPKAKPVRSVKRKRIGTKAARPGRCAPPTR
jgi:hypothetical protein